jgi:hypothetical protein
MSSSNIRVVKFNEDLFKTPSRTQKRKKPDKPIKIKPAKKVSNKSIKNSILKEIRKNQEKKYNELLVEPTITPNSLTKDFENDFKNSVDFMKKVADKHKETKLNQTIRNHNASVTQGTQSPMENTDLIPVDLDTIMIDPPSFNPPSPFVQPSFNQQPSFVQPSPFAQSPSFNQQPSFVQPSFNQQPSFVQSSPFVQPSFNHEPLAEPMKILPNPNYGCLKNGSLPTYRSYHNKTMKAGQLPPPLMTERIKSPAELLLIENIKQREIQKNTKNQIHKQKRYKKLLRRTYRVGKDKYRPRVGVLLPNKTIRSNVTTKSYMLKQTPIDEIRKTLVKQGFIKVGSSAPNDVLQKIYESIKMIDGDINNHNPDNLLYNFFNQPS